MIGRQERRNLEVQLRGCCCTDPGDEKSLCSKPESPCCTTAGGAVQLAVLWMEWTDCSPQWYLAIFWIVDKLWLLYMSWIFFSQLVITYFMIQHITVLNFHKVRFVYLLFNCFWVYLSYIRSPLLQIYKTFFHIFFFQYLDFFKKQILKWICKLLWYAQKVGKF